MSEKNINTNENDINEINNEGEVVEETREEKKKQVNIPLMIGVSFTLLIALGVFLVVLKLGLWNKGQAYIMTNEDYQKIKLDTIDNVVLLPPSVICPDTFDGTTTVLVLGNDSYYEGVKDGSDILSLMGQEIPDAEIINVCIPDTYLTSYRIYETSPEECPEDYFCMTWLVSAMCWKDFARQEEALNYLNPEKYDIERHKEVIEILKGINIDDVDVVMFCYDGHDYRTGRVPVVYNGPDAVTENTTTLLGALYTTIYILNTYNQDIQYVYVSPAFCYGIDENGQKVSCAQLNTSNGTMADNFNAARLITNYYGVSYVDMYSGVSINEENGETTLESDGITPTKKARQLMADRLVTLLKERF